MTSLPILRTMTRWKFFTVLLTLTVFLLLGCSKQTEELRLTELSEYYPLQVGRVYVYRLDSSLIPFFGTELDTRSYHARDSIADTIRDNLDRLSYRVYRFVTDTLEQNAWKPIGAYYITPADNSTEVVDDNNLRIIKLVKPIRDGYSWSGNSYIDTKTAGSLYQYMDGWNFQYQNTGQSYSVLYGTLPNTITVLQVDDTSPPGPFDPNNYQQRNYSVEVYAKGVGLIYKEFLHSVWQVTPPPAGYDNDTYGIKLNLISVR